MMNNDDADNLIYSEFKLSHQCEECGLFQPLVALFVIIPSASWRGMIEILLDDLPEAKCQRCSAKISLPAIITFFSEKINKSVLYFDSKYSYDLLEKFKLKISESGISFCDYDVTNDFEKLKKFINEHVLRYKSILKDMMMALQGGYVDSFVKNKWRDITPDVFGAAFVAMTGIVPEIGGYGIDVETGEKIAIKELFIELENKLSEIQVLVWLQLVLSDKNEASDLEYLLSHYIKKYAIYDISLDKFGMIIKIFLEDNSSGKIPFQYLYAALSLYASAKYIKGEVNKYENEWAQSYFILELEGADNMEMLSCRVSKTRAKETISKKAIWNFIGNKLCYFFNDVKDRKKHQDFVSIIESLDIMVSDLGFKGLVDEVLSTLQVNLVSSKDKALWIQSEDKSVFNDLFNSIVENIKKQDTEIDVGSILRTVTNIFIEFGSVKNIEDFFDQIIPLINKYDNRVSVECWFGECMKLMRAPKLFIDKVGIDPRKWEDNLSLHWRLSLGNERSNALRILGQPKKALELTDKLINLITDFNTYSEEYYILMKNRAILHRESGMPDKSVIELEALLKTASLKEKSTLLESYAATLSVLKRHDDAILAIKEALNLIDQKDDISKMRLCGVLAQELSIKNEFHEALIILEKNINVPILDNSFLVYMSAYLNLLLRGVELSELHITKIKKWFEILPNYLKDLLKYGDKMIVHQIINNSASIADELNNDDVYKLLTSQGVLYRSIIGYDSPEMILRNALHACKNNDILEVRKQIYLLWKEIPKIYGFIEDLSIAYNTTLNLQILLNRFIHLLFTQKMPLNIIRLTAEIKRDMIGKSMLMRKSDDAKENEYDMISFEDFDYFEKINDCAVMELISTGTYIFCVFSFKNSKNQIESHLIDIKNNDMYRLRERIMHRLSVWYKGRSGDPFDDKDWILFSNYICEKVRAFIPNNTHIIVIEEESLVGIPWHVIFSEHWQCSYAPSWLDILHNSSQRMKNPKIGVLSVHRHKDPISIQKCFSQGVKDIYEICKRKNIEFIVFENSNADKKAFESLLLYCDIISIFCHGYVDSKNHEVALLLSDNGLLPPLHAPNKRDDYDVYKLSWRDMQRMTGNASIIISAACSTGLQLKAGAGEYMGIYGALRHKGIKSLIGPRWDVIADDIIPILNSVLFRYISGESLNVAVYNSCKQAEQKMPKWLAWAISLEGKWL